MGASILSINANISSLRAQRKLGVATDSLSSSFEKLSSGLRINNASDDAAGLSMASSLKADTRIYSQGVRNLNDGVSALNIADGALSNLSSIVIRMKELAEQSANGAVGWKQRESLDAEAQALAKEYFRISRTTDFNGLKLFDGTLQGLTLQAGYGASGSIHSSLGGALGTGTFSQAVSYTRPTTSFASLAIADLDGNGALDVVTAGYLGGSNGAAVWFNNGDGSFQNAVIYRGKGSNGTCLGAVADLDGNGALDMVITDYVSAYAAGGFASVLLNDGRGSFSATLSFRTGNEGSRDIFITDLNGDGAPDLVNEDAVRLGNGDGTFRAALFHQTGGEAISLSDLNGDSVTDLVTAGGSQAYIRLGNGDGTFKGSLSYETESGYSFALSLSDVNGDGALDLVTAGRDSDSTGYATIRLGNGNGTFKASLSYETESVESRALSMSDLNGDGILDLVTAGQSSSESFCTIRLGNGDGTFAKALSYQHAGFYSNDVGTADVNGDGVLDLLTAGSGYLTVRFSDTRDGISPILPFSLSTQGDALQALSMLKGALERLSAQRGRIGAFQSRLSSALSTLGSTVLEYRGAQSRVEDIDIAKESANLVRHQIIQQAAASVLAQANQGPALALRLLAG